jgi:hypothetical protein
MFFIIVLCLYCLIHASAKKCLLIWRWANAHSSSSFCAVGATVMTLQNMFAMMALGKSTFFIPRDFWSAFKDYDGSPIDVKEHQDAYEFFTRLQVGSVPARALSTYHLLQTFCRCAPTWLRGFNYSCVCRSVLLHSDVKEHLTAYEDSLDCAWAGGLTVHAELEILMAIAACRLLLTIT